MPRGRPPYQDVLTPAEWRIANAVRHGFSNRDISRRMGVSLDAIKFHVSNAVTKLSLRNRQELRHWRGIPRASALHRRDLVMTESGGVTTGAIGQVSRHVSDIAKAVGWYRDVLGLSYLFTAGPLAFFDCGGTRLFLSAEGNSTGESILYFRSNDIHASYDTLRARGVSFRGAPHMIHRHPNGVEEWMAFFDDPDGQLLALMSQTAPPTATNSATP